MHYVRQSLSENEELIHVAHFHWIYDLMAFINILLGIGGSIAVVILAITYEPAFMGQTKEAIGWLNKVQALHPAIKIFAFFILLIGFYRFAHMMIVKVTTEIAITNSRLIYKRGLVARYVGEMNIDRIEGVNVLQSIMGRLLNYGRIMVRGMGIGEVVLPPIADPIAFRKAIERAKDV